MAVFRVERNKGYTVMSNHHLRNKELSLKAKGLLSQMLSLPEDWDYTLKGLSLINREKIDAIREAIKELERAGYIVRSRERDEKGRLRGADYVIFEQPQPPTPDLPTLENPTLDNPTQEKPTLEKPTLENPTQLNKDIQRTDLPKKEKIITDEQSTHSIPILSPNPSPCREAATPPERKGTEATAQSAVDIYREIIKDNIDYHILKQDMKFDSDRLDEIVDLMLETVCTARKRVRIAGDDYPAELVKSKFMKLDGEHIRFVLDCMRENTTKIRNIKQYLKAALFNAPSTIGNYYTSLVAHDMASGALSPKKPQSATRTIIHAMRAKACNHPQPQKEDFIMAQKMTGALVFDERTDRYDIRFDLNSYYGGLHCGECFDVFVRGKWKPTRIEYGDNWYLVGIRAEDLNGLRVRI
ncbi:hypothetical protein HMPREF9099_02801 [Lachnospiraceae bacterium oral taxon 082 str. F0431]|nr:hypothetical protein HMPREF9099_02801 [Lachnospiraceae bacterium oral taxon 082 str. F0431]